MTNQADFTIQEMSLKALRIDHSLQSRVKTDIEHVRRLTEAALDMQGAPFRSSPIDVFEDTEGQFWVAEGFHRTEAAGKAHKASIWARVYKGSRQDMILHSAQANLRFDALTITREDKIKALRMMFADSELWTWCDEELARRCGLGDQSVRKLKLKWSAETGIPLPDVVKVATGDSFRSFSVGRIRLGQTFRGKPYIGTEETAGKIRFRGHIDGKKYYLGSDKRAAEKKFEEMVSRASVDGSEKKARKVLLDLRNLKKWLSRRVSFRGGHRVQTGYPDLILPGAVARVARHIGPGSIAEAIGDVLLWRQEVDPSLRAIVLCYPGDDVAAHMDHAKTFGVEFLTPEEVVEQFAGKAFPDQSAAG